MLPHALPIIILRYRLRIGFIGILATSPLFDTGEE